METSAPFGLAWSEEDAARIASGAGMRVRAVQDSSEGGKHYRAGDEGFVLGASCMAEGRLEVLFDTGCTANPPQERLQLIFTIGCKVITICDSSDKGKYYQKGDAGVFLGASEMGFGRASVLFDRTGKVENPLCANLCQCEEVSEELDESIIQHRRVFLLRHGQARHNIKSETSEEGPFPDAPLTEIGKAQASSWVGHIDKFGVEAVLVSPLRRALHTACLAFEHEKVPLQLCRAARELWWDQEENQPISQDQLHDYLRELPRGDDVSEADAASLLGLEEPTSEESSIAQLREVLLARLESTILVVCHWGVIKALCGIEPANCEILECALCTSGALRVLNRYAPPWMTTVQGLRVRLVNADPYDDLKSGDTGFCIGPSENNIAEIVILFDDGRTSSLREGDFEIIFVVGAIVTARNDSSEDGKYYKAGETGVFLGASDMGLGRASVMFHRSGLIENPLCTNLQALDNAVPVSPTMDASRTGDEE